MKFRIVVTMLLVIGATFTTPAGAASARSSVLYLSQTAATCESPIWSLVPEASDTNECSVIPRFLVQGHGVSFESESFVMSKKTMVRLDATRKVTGLFVITTPGPIHIAGSPVGKEAPGYAGADFKIKIGKTVLETVHVEGPVAPTQPVSSAFSLDLPKSLNNTPTNLISVDVTWTTCVGVVACAVRVGGAETHSNFVLPTR